MASETKRTAPDMDAIIAQAKKDGKLKTVPLNWKEVYYTTALLYLQAMSTRNWDGQRKSIRRLV